MRKIFATSVIDFAKDSNCYFLTADLGFLALEGVRDAFGDRFINAGISEQNLIGVAAGLAKEGHKVFVYSIAPFIYARPYEQIRNDLCFSNLPVCLVGNGGGYAYGHMGPTHHALEDCAAMAALGVKVLVPAFDSDIPELIKNITTTTYLRLGYDEKPKEAKAPEYKQWRIVLEGEKGTLVALGPLAGVAWEAFKNVKKALRPTIWAATTITPETAPQELFSTMDGKEVYIIEEHVAAGGLGMNLAYVMTKKNIRPSKFTHRVALRYPTKTYGSQNFHRIQCGLDIESLRTINT